MDVEHACQCTWAVQFKRLLLLQELSLMLRFHKQLSQGTVGTVSPRGRGWSCSLLSPPGACTHPQVLSTHWRWMAHVFCLGEV